MRVFCPLSSLSARRLLIQQMRGLRILVPDYNCLPCCGLLLHAFWILHWNWLCCIPHILPWACLSRLVSCSVYCYISNLSHFFSFCAMLLLLSLPLLFLLLLLLFLFLLPLLLLFFLLLLLLILLLLRRQCCPFLWEWWALVQSWAVSLSRAKPERSWLRPSSRYFACPI